MVGQFMQRITLVALVCAAISCAQPANLVARAETAPDNKFRNTVITFACSLGGGFVFNVALFIAVHCWCKGKSPPDASTRESDPEDKPQSLHNTENIHSTESNHSSKYYSANFITYNTSAIISSLQESSDRKEAIIRSLQESSDRQEAIDNVCHEIAKAKLISSQSLANIREEYKQVSDDYNNFKEYMAKEEYINAALCHKGVELYVSSFKELLEQCKIYNDRAKSAINKLVRGGISSDEYMDKDMIENGLHIADITEYMKISSMMLADMNRKNDKIPLNS